jgi:hypothetical protein
MAQQLWGGQVRLETVNVKYILNAHGGRELNLKGDWRALRQQNKGTKKSSLKGEGWSD